MRNDHDLIIDALNEWIKENGHEFDIPNEKLIEDEDFRLYINRNELSQAASIACSCGIKIQLGVVHGNFSLCNYYKHLKSKKCIKKKKKMSRAANSNESYETIDEGSVNKENRKINSTIDYVQPLTSTMTIDSPASSNQSGKRTITQHDNSVLKKQRI